jgi:hypothetical protein
MLIYIGPRRQTHLIRHARYDPRRPRMIGRTYSWLFRTRRLPAATYIFVGVDRLDMPERRLAGQFYRYINAQGPGFSALNDPATGMGRYRFLRTLYQRGINQFSAYLATEGYDGLRLPAFVRSASMSLPPLTSPLPSRAQLDSEIERLIVSGHPPEDLLIIELCGEPFVPGLWRKQAAYRFGDHYTASASIYSAEWYVKRSTQVLVADTILDYDREVLRTNPFEALAREVFAIANVEHGRIDIGFTDGRPQVYEVNYNPDLRTQMEMPNVQPALRDIWNRSDDMAFAALRAIDRPRGISARSLTTPELTAFRLRFWRNYAPQRF